MKLSFCIPTYNRIQLLQELLNSIFTDLTSDVQIVISDNGSTDGTDKFILDLQKKHSCITYFRFPHTVEVGQNLLNSVHLAEGEYCWLMSDDDKLEPGALLHVLSLLNTYSNLTGISVNVEGYDSQLKFKKTIRYTHSLHTQILFQDALSCYQSLGAWVGFWSALIVNKSLWNNALQSGSHLKYLGYHHLYLVTKMMALSPSWLFTPQKCVSYRSDNESFSSEYGVLKRFEIDLISYKAIGLEIFGDESSHIQIVFNTVIKQFLFWQIISCKLKKHPFHVFSQMLKMSFKAFGSSSLFWLRILPAALAPSFFITSLRRIKRLLF